MNRGTRVASDGRTGVVEHRCRGMANEWRLVRWDDVDREYVHVRHLTAVGHARMPSNAPAHVKVTLEVRKKITSAGMTSPFRPHDSMASRLVVTDPADQDWRASLEQTRKEQR